MSTILPHHIFKLFPLPSLLLSINNQEYKIIDTTDFYAEISGLKSFELLHKSLFEIYNYKGTSITELEQSLHEVLEHKVPHKISGRQYDFQKNNTENKYWEIEHIPVFGDEGEVAFIMHSMIDVTESFLLRQHLAEANVIIGQRNEVLKKAETISKFGTWELDLVTNELHWSDGVFRICGYEPNAFEVTFERGLGIIHPDDRTLAIKELENTLQTGKEYKIEKRFVLEDNTIKHIISRGSVINDADGKPLKLFGVFQDITDEKIQQMALEKAKDELNKIMDSSLDIICTIDGDGNFVQVSEACFKIWGYHPAELIGTNFLKLVHQNDHDITIQSAKDVKNGIETTNFENRYVRKDGSVVPMIWSAHWDDTEKVNYCIAKDATEKKANELALIESAKQYKYLFENNPSPMFIWDFKTLEIVDCNEQALLKYGYSRDEFLALTILDIRPASEIPQVYEATLSEENYYNYHKKLRIHKKKNGELLKIEGIGHLMDYKGRRVALVLINDVTEKEAVLQELRDNEIKLRTATNIAKLGYWQINIDKQHLYWSDEVYAMWGQTKNTFELSFESFFDTIHPDDKEAFTQKQTEVISGKSNLDIEYRIIMPDNSVKWVHEIGKIIRDEDGNPILLEGTVQDITEQKNGQIALTERNVFIETALENLPIGMAVNKIDEGTTTLMNKKFSEIYGWPTDVIVDVASFFEKVYPDEKYREEISKRIMSDIESGDESKMNWEGIVITTQSGEKRIINAKNIPIYEQNLMISTVVDVTEKIEAQKALEESNERYKFVSKATSDAIWDWDLETGTLFWGDGHENLFGHKHKPDAQVVDSWTSHIHPNDLDRVVKGIRKVIDGEETNWKDEYQYQKADGQYTYVIDKGFVIRNEQGNALRMVGAVQDVSLQKAREQQLKLLESVVVNTKDAVMITEAEPFDDPGPKIIYVNEAFTKMTGFTAEEVIGKNPRILQGEKSDKYELARLGAALRRWETCEITTINYKKNGEEFWINFTVIPVADETGWFTHWIAIERDVTEIKIAEEAQKQLKQLELSLEKEKEINILKTRFTALASHEFRTPIATIVSGIDILEIYVNMIESESLKGKISFHLNKIVSQSNRLTEMLRDILLLEKTAVNTKEYNIENVDIVELINEINQQYYFDRKDGRILEINLPENHRLVHSNNSFLNHIINNLISNAFKYSPNAKNPSLALAFYADYYTIVVTDYGLGIPVADKEHLFELFYRANNVLYIEGTGLGLTITKEFTNKLGGQISFVSQEGIGTTFTLIFPYRTQDIGLQIG